MKIAFLCGSGQTGGAERSVLDLVWSLREADDSVVPVLIVPAEGPLAALARSNGIDVTVLPYPHRLAALGEHGGRADDEGGAIRGLLGIVLRGAGAAAGIARYTRTLARVLRTHGPDVVHSHALKMHILGTLARPPRAALLWHFHEAVLHRPAFRRFVHRWWRSADGVVAVSRAVASDVAAASDGHLAPRVLHNGIDLSEFAPDGPVADLDLLSGIERPPSEVVRVGIVGATGRFKGQDVFLKAVARLGTPHLVRAYVVGGPLYVTGNSQSSLAELRTLAASLGIAGRTGFTGFVQNVSAALRALDVVVHATVRPEPFGLVVAEAMGCGRAVVASDAGGVSEIVDAEVTALTHAPGDVEGLAHAISRLVEDAALRARIAAAGLQFAHAHFDRATLGPAMMPVYADAIARRRARQG